MEAIPSLPIDGQRGGAAGRGRRQRVGLSWRVFQQNRLAVTGLVLMAMVVVAAAAAPWIAPYDPLALEPSAALNEPTAAYVMGTDNYGRDVLSRVIYAARLDLFIAIVSVSIGAAIGVVLGALAGYRRGVVDEVLMRLLDVVQAFPAFILAMGLAVALGAGTRTIIIVVAVIMVPVFARLTRSVMISERERGYADAARSMGASHAEIMGVHLLPNCMTPVLTQFPLSMSYAILDAAALSFIGLGVTPPTPEWGTMVREGVRYLTTGQWWIAIFPGAAMAVTILAFNLLGDGLRDVLDPRMRR